MSDNLCRHMSEALKGVEDKCLFFTGVLVCPFCDRMEKGKTDGRGRADASVIGEEERARRKLVEASLSEWFGLAFTDMAMTPRDLAESLNTTEAQVIAWRRGIETPSAVEKLRLLEGLIKGIRTFVIARHLSTVQDSYDVIKAKEVNHGDRFLRLPALDDPINKHKQALLKANEARGKTEIQFHAWDYIHHAEASRFQREGAPPHYIFIRTRRLLPATGTYGTIFDEFGRWLTLAEKRDVQPIQIVDGLDGVTGMDVARWRRSSERPAEYVQKQIIANLRRKFREQLRRFYISAIPKGWSQITAPEVRVGDKYKNVPDKDATTWALETALDGTDRGPGAVHWSVVMAHDVDRLRGKNSDYVVKRQDPAVDHHVYD